MTKGKHQPLSDFEPSIYKGKDGLFHGRVVVGFNPDGSYIRPHRQSKDKKEVKRKIAELVAKRDSGFAWDADNVLFGAWLQHWLEKIIRVHRAHKTYRGYRSAVKCHILPELGGIRLSDLETEDLERLYTSMYKRGCSDTLVHLVHRVARSALGVAVERKRIATNPATRAYVRIPEEVEIDPLLIDEIALAVHNARSMDNFPRWSLALLMGLRQGEALGLSWSEINLDTGVIAVRRQLQRITWEHGCKLDSLDLPTCGRARGGSCPQRHGGGLLLVPVKTKRSKRPIKVPEFIRLLLVAHRQEQVAHRLRAPEWHESDLVFCTATGGPIDPKRDRQAWHALLERCGLRHARLHDARHSAASLLLALEVDQRVVMDIMGWTEMRTAQRYMHVVDSQRRDAAEKLEKAMTALQSALVSGVGTGSL